MIWSVVWSVKQIGFMRIIISTIQIIYLLMVNLWTKFRWRTNSEAHISMHVQAIRHKIIDSTNTKRILIFNFIFCLFKLSSELWRMKNKNKNKTLNFIRKDIHFVRVEDAKKRDNFQQIIDNSICTFQNILNIYLYIYIYSVL